MCEIQTPTLDKMLRLQEQTQICGEFLDFLQNKYAMFDLKTKRDTPYFVGSGDYINTEKILAEFFHIDLSKAEKEKEMLLKAEIDKQMGNNVH